MAKMEETMEFVRSWALGLGLLFMVIGFIVVLAPGASTLALDIFLGLMLLVLGVAQVAFAMGARKWKGGDHFLAGGVLSLLVGLVLLFFPYGSIITLTLLLALLLIVQGVVAVSLSFKLKKECNADWLLFDGLITLLLGIIIFAGWPANSSWVLGLLFGIYVLFAGITFVMIYLALGKRK